MTHRLGDWLLDHLMLVVRLQQDLHSSSAYESWRLVGIESHGQANAALKSSKLAESPFSKHLRSPILLTAIKMADVETYPPQYHQYLATQRRVSNWVKHTDSQIQSSNNSRKPSSKRSSSAESYPMAHTSSMSGQRKSSRRNSGATTRHSMNAIEQPPITPAIALISSSLFVCALLPSILTISAFVVLLTLASMESGDQSRGVSKDVNDERQPARAIEV
ncbi:hypothetical protein GALMADRAFT_144327 [Galerina marginata CBS 339.88]|uniref:Uncharacterized protein n=1 Tax=Galerina marginata (strain CBS 339.88) TaxID=685588 RepID=A0A067SLE5_GALM3|nr:hypothetical protein GALMADRAFT_144327 [Galerina marginata CBS 339.88]